MKSHGSVDPGRFSIEEIPGTKLTLIRLYQNVKPVETENFTGFEYDEYHVKVETWDGVAQNVEDNYDVFLEKGKDNEIDRSNIALYNRQVKNTSALHDLDELAVDQEYRLTLLELGLTQ